MEIFRLFAACVFLTFAFPATAATINSQIVLSLEEPGSGSSYASIANVRGWAVAPIPIDHIELYVDGAFETNIPTGGKRADVGTAYSSFPNSDQSGFSMAYNYGGLTPGPHTFRVRAVDSKGDYKDVQASLNTLRFHKPFFRDPSAVDLSDAEFTVTGTSITADGMQVDGKSYRTTLSWRTAAQGFVITKVATASARAVRQNEASGEQSTNKVSATANDQIVLTLEEPVTGLSYASVANIRGWVVGPLGIDRVELYIDGTFTTDIPVGGKRPDVGSAYPTYPGSAQSGFSMAFNYGELAVGAHTFKVRAIDQTGKSQEATATFTVERFSKPFISDPASIDLSRAIVTGSGSMLQISGMRVDGELHNIRLEWRIAAQGFTFSEISPYSVPATINEAIAVNVPTPPIGPLRVVGLSEATVTGNGSAVQLSVPQDTVMPLYLLDSEDNLIGMTVSEGSGGGAQIDPASTALGLVLTAPFNLYAYGLKTTRLKDAIETSPRFSKLVATVRSVQTADPRNLLGSAHPEIFDAVVDVVREVRKDLAAEKVLSSGREAAKSDSTSRAFALRSDYVPWPKRVGGQVRIYNPRFVPFGLNGVDDAKGAIFEPSTVRQREFGWGGWNLLSTGELPSIPYPINTGLVCAAKASFDASFIGKVNVLVPGGGPIASITYDIITGLGAEQSGSVEEVMLFRAKVNGYFSWYISLMLNAAQSLPGVGGLIGQGGELFVHATDALKRGDLDIPILKGTVDDTSLSAVASLIADFMGALYDESAQAGSHLRKFAHYVLRDGRRIAALRASVNTIAKWAGHIANIIVDPGFETVP